MARRSHIHDMITVSHERVRTKINDEMLSSARHELTAELRHAILILDKPIIDVLIGRIEVHGPETGKVLKRLEDDYQLE